MSIAMPYCPVCGYGLWVLGTGYIISNTLRLDLSCHVCNGWRHYEVKDFKKWKAQKPDYLNTPVVWIDLATYMK